MKLNRFINPAAAGLLLLGSGGIASARHLQPEPFLQGDSNAFACVEDAGPTSRPASGGLDENWHRIYDSTIGRYLQPDPVGGSRKQGQSWSNYPYVMGMPLRATDPMGLLTVVDASENCERGCFAEKLFGPFKNNWDEGLARARQLGQRPACRAYFARLGANIDDLLADGTNPPVLLGGQVRGRAWGSWDGLKVTIPCRTLSASANEIAGTLFHELAHAPPADADDIFSGGSPDFTTGAYGADRACREGAE